MRVGLTLLLLPVPVLALALVIMPVFFFSVLAMRRKLRFRGSRPMGPDRPSACAYIDRQAKKFTTISARRRAPVDIVVGWLPLRPTSERTPSTKAESRAGQARPLRS